MLTTCRYFDIVGNRCSRVTCGKCDDLPDCEFKYIEELKKILDCKNGTIVTLARTRDRLKFENERLEKIINRCKQTLQEIKKVA